MRVLTALLAAAAAATLAISCATTAAAATSADACGATGSATFTAPPTFDPFAQGGATFTGSLTLTRTNPPLGSKTSEAVFYLRSNVTGIHATIVNSNDVTSGGGDIVKDPTEAVPVLNYSNPAPGTAHVVFGGNNAANDTKVVTFNLTLDQNTDLAAGGSFPLDIVGSCKGTGGSTANPFEIDNAIIVNIPIYSALQAYYSGAALDFGEIGTVTDGQASTRTTPQGQITVRSTGPYSVAVTPSSNSYRLANVADRISYQLNFLGQNPSNASPTFATRTCSRAGVVGGVTLPISATLQQGGLGHLPGAYSDTVTVTITPLVSTAVGTPCP